MMAKWIVGAALLIAANGAAAAEPEARAVTISSASGPLSGTFYLGTPGKGAPGILLLHTAGGLLPADHAYGRRLASEGFAVLLVPYTIGWADSTNAPLADAVGWLAASPEVGGGPIGVVGFSLGASKALILAGRRPEIRAVVAYYGTYDVTISKFAKAVPLGITAPSPVDVAKQIAGPVLLLNAEQDDETPSDQTEKMLASLAGKTVELVRYPKGKHMFEREPRFHPQGNRTKFGTETEYDPEAAQDSWRRTVAWFRKYLAGP